MTQEQIVLAARILGTTPAALAEALRDYIAKQQKEAAK